MNVRVGIHPVWFANAGSGCRRLLAMAPELAALLERLNMRILNIRVVDKHDPGFEEVEPGSATRHEEPVKVDV